jgi:hypothetical protein
MRIIIAFVLAGFLLGCQGNAPTDKTAKKQQPSSPSVQVPSAPAPHVTVSGTVLERIDVESGMYLRLKTPNGEVWAAVSKADARKGSTVTVVNAVPMDGFESKSLKRKFDRIVFGSLAGTPAPKAQNPPAPPAGHGTPAALQHPPLTAAPADVGEIKVAKAEGADGKTVSEIFAARVSLKNASVAVRGKVVKFNAGIMGKNWIHLRDGSGSRAKQDDDLTVTTRDSAAVGDVVLAQGVVHVDRDFGAGYTYHVIIEDAKVSK